MTAWMKILRRAAWGVDVQWLHRVKKEGCPVLQSCRQGPLVNEVIISATLVNEVIIISATLVLMCR